MAKLTLKKALAAGLVELRGVPMAALVAVQSMPHWVSDERKLSDNPRAVFLVVEAPDDAIAAWLRASWPGLIVLRDGWYTRATSVNRMPDTSFDLSAFRWEPVRYRQGLGARDRIAVGANVRGIRV